MDRNLDGVFFRIKRNGFFDNVCFSDLTEEEMDSMLSGRDVKWLKSLCKILGKTIKKIGDDLDIVNSIDEDDDLCKELGVEPYECFTLIGMQDFLFYCTSNYLYGCILSFDTLPKLDDELVKDLKFQPVSAILTGVLKGKLKVDKRLKVKKEIGEK